MTSAGLPAPARVATAARATAPGALLQTIGVLVAGEGLARLAAFVASALLARRLGPDGFGIVGFATAVTGYLAYIVDGGLHEIGAREVARDPDRARAIYFQATSVRLVTAGLLFAILSAVVALLPHASVVQVVVLLSGLSFFTLALDASWVLRGLERPRGVAAGIVVTQTIYAAGVVWFVHGPADVRLVPLLLLAGEVAGAAIVGATVVGRGRPGFPVRAGARLLWSARHIAAARLLRVVTVTFDVVLLGLLATHRDVGLYTAAYRVIFLLMAVVTSIGSAYLPSYTRLAAAGPGPMRELLTRSLETGVMVGAPLVAGAMIVAEPLLVLLFGPEYRDGAVALQILAVSAAFLFFHWSVRNLLVARNRGRLQLTMTAVAAGVTVVLDLFLIPRYGIAGAALATLATEATLAVTGFVVLWRLQVCPSPRRAVRPLAAAAVMSAAAWAAVGRLPVLVVVVGAGLVYVAALAMLGGLPRRGFPVFGPAPAGTP